MNQLFGGVYATRHVLVTGHTGFKGSWLVLWLQSLGAEVSGLALNPDSDPSHWQLLNLQLKHEARIDLRDAAAVTAAVTASAPEIVFHLAAQPLVRRSYREPAATFDTNVGGLVHLLDAVRACPSVRAVVNATTDKVYEPHQAPRDYDENDRLGGHDPYSTSKACAELVSTCYRRSYFDHDDGRGYPVHLATARAGNVIGGGDWALDRIVPDCIRALARDESIPVRNKIATRPWQHVLEPLSGYLWLGAALARPTPAALRFPPAVYASAFNFGPALASNRTVAELVQEILKHWHGRWEDRSDPNAVHEAKLLNLATDKAHHLLGWSPAWPFAETILRTVAWYREAAQAEPASLHAFTAQQIQSYVTAAQAAGLSWAR